MKWEYKFVHFDPDLEDIDADIAESKTGNRPPSKPSIGKRLTRLGEEGWEAVGFSEDENIFYVLLKRPNA